MLLEVDGVSGGAGDEFAALAKTVPARTHHDHRSNIRDFVSRCGSGGRAEGVANLGHRFGRTSSRSPAASHSGRSSTGPACTRRRSSDRPGSRRPRKAGPSRCPPRERTSASRTRPPQAPSPGPVASCCTSHPRSHRRPSSIGPWAQINTAAAAFQKVNISARAARGQLRSISMIDLTVARPMEQCSGRFGWQSGNERETARKECVREREREREREIGRKREGTGRTHMSCWQSFRAQFSAAPPVGDQSSSRKMPLMSVVGERSPVRCTSTSQSTRSWFRVLCDPERERTGGGTGGRWRKRKRERV